MKKVQKQKIRDLMLEPSTFALGLEIARQIGYSEHKRTVVEFSDGIVSIGVVRKFEKSMITFPMLFGFYAGIPYDGAVMTYNTIEADHRFKDSIRWSLGKLILGFPVDVPRFLVILCLFMWDNLPVWKRKSRI